MNNVNKTLYIPLYGKAYVSKKGVILHDEKAEEIWDAEGFELKGKARSKWLAYNMGMRSAVFDQWLKQQMDLDSGAVIVHIGCGMDSRVLRVGTGQHAWYDIDFPDVIRERKRYYKESDEYHMIESDARNNAWIDSLPKNKNAIILMEGVSMYFQTEELTRLLKHLTSHFQQALYRMRFAVFAENKKFKQNSERKRDGKLIFSVPLCVYITTKSQFFQDCQSMDLCTIIISSHKRKIVL